MNPASASCSTSFTPSPSMFIASREAKCFRRFPNLGWAGGVGAESSLLVLAHHDLRAADRALLEHTEFLLRTTALFLYRLDDLGYHVACPLDEDDIADADVFAFDLTLIVQGGPAYLDAADVDRFEIGYRGEYPRPSHLNPDVLYLGGRLQGLELVGYCPLGIAGSDAELLLLRAVVDLEDRAVDLVAQVVPLPFEVLVVLPNLVETGALLGEVQIDLEPPLRQRVQDLPLGVEVATVTRLGHFVEEGVKAPFGGDVRIQLPQGTGRCVSRVGERVLSGLLPTSVELFELALVHIYLAAHHKALRNRLRFVQ